VDPQCRRSAISELERGVEWLNDMNPQVMHRMLDLIEAEGARHYAPALKLWTRCASRKVGAHIHGVLRAMADSGSTGQGQTGGS
jgi:hypothetical protein